MEVPLSDPLAGLGADLILLSVRRRDGKILCGQRLRFGLAAAELARLAVIGRIDVTGEQIVVVDPDPTGHAELDAALASLAGGWPPPRPATWLGLPRPGIREAYLDKLVADGLLAEKQADGRRGWPRSGSRPSARRFAVLATDRAADARARLDVIARSADLPLDPGHLALGGLAAAIGLPRFLYPGREAAPSRDSLSEIATHIAPARNGKRRPAPAPAPDATTSAMYVITWAALLAASNLAPRRPGGSLSTWSAVRPRH